MKGKALNGSNEADKCGRAVVFSEESSSLSSPVSSFQFLPATQFQIVYDGRKTNPGYFI